MRNNMRNNESNIRLYFLGSYDSRRGYGGHSYSGWTTGGDYAIRFEDGSVDFFGSRCWADGSRSIIWLKEWEGKDIPPTAEEIAPADAGEKAKAYISSVLRKPILTEDEKVRLWLELEAIPSSGGQKAHTLEFYTRTQAEKILEGQWNLSPVVLSSDDWEEDYYVQRKIDASSFPGGEYSLYSDIRYYHFNVGWNAGDHYEVRMMLTPWDKTRWGSKKAHDEWLAEEARREAEAEAQYRLRLEEERAKRRAEYEAWKKSPEGIRQAALEAEIAAEEARREAEREAEEARKEAEKTERRKQYARRCTATSRRVNVPFEVVLTLGPDTDYNVIRERIKEYADEIGMEVWENREVAPGVTVSAYFPKRTWKKVLYELTMDGWRRPATMVEEIIGIKTQWKAPAVAGWLVEELKALR